jgi:hypothetical protein
MIRSRASEWARFRERVPIVRNVGRTPKNKGSIEENAQLIAAIQEVGSSSWSRVATFIAGRTGKQCRERWLDKLSPDLLKDDWSAEEDSILLAKQEELGHSWTEIGKFLIGRPSGAVKNRWNWLVKKDIPNHRERFEEIVAEQKGGELSQNDFSSRENQSKSSQHHSKSPENHCNLRQNDWKSRENHSNLR